MNRSLSLVAALLLAPALASAYGGNYGKTHCTPHDIRTGRCNKSGHTAAPPVAQGNATLGPQDGVPGGPNVPGSKGAATPMGGGNNALPGGGIPGGMDPAAAQAAMAALKNSPAGPDGKCPNGATPVPGLNGTTSCINMGGGAH